MNSAVEVWIPFYCKINVKSDINENKIDCNLDLDSVENMCVSVECRSGFPKLSQVAPLGAITEI